MTRLYLIRHGQSEANLARIFTGSGNYPLTGLGKKQAVAAAEYLKDKNIDVVYASPLVRAYETGKAVSDLCGVPIITEDGLKEICAGEWEGKFFDDLVTLYPESYDTWLNDIGRCIPVGGEPVKELYARAVNTVLKIIDENPDKNIAIATHATPIRALGAFWSGIAAENLKDIPWAANASITSICAQDGKFFDFQYGFCDHLGENITKLPKNV